jgi:hypothetical protein
MWTRKVVVAATAALGLVALAAVHAQQAPAKGKPGVKALTAQDYIDIRALAARRAWPGQRRETARLTQRVLRRMRNSTARPPGEERRLTRRVEKTFRSSRMAAAVPTTCATSWRTI